MLFVLRTDFLLQSKLVSILLFELALQPLGLGLVLLKEHVAFTLATLLHDLQLLLLVLLLLLESLNLLLDRLPLLVFASQLLSLV